MEKNPSRTSKIYYGGLSGNTKIKIWQQHYTFQVLDDDDDDDDGDDDDNHEDYRYRLTCQERY
jgi:hypothetical protein